MVPPSALDDMSVSEDGARVAPPEDAGPSAPSFKGVPPELAPKQQVRMDNEARAWVQLPARASIDTGRSKRPKATLKTGTWYQVKLDPDGSQVFYDKEGMLLGRNLSPDPVQVRVWVPKKEQQ